MAHGVIKRLLTLKIQVKIMARLTMTVITAIDLATSVCVCVCVHTECYHVVLLSSPISRVLPFPVSGDMFNIMVT